MTTSVKREPQSSVPEKRSYAMPMLLWFPMIVAAGMYQAISDDLAQWHRACTGFDRDV
jgi:hypothetical protein